MQGVLKESQVPNTSTFAPVSAQSTPEINNKRYAPDDAFPTPDRVKRRRIAVDLIVQPVAAYMARLPFDALVEIFSHLAGPISLDARYGIWSISRVCRSWRSATLSYPLFWSELLLDINSEPAPKAGKDILALCLENSGAVPLRITMSTKKTKMGTVLLGLLLAEAYRWKDVYFVLPFDYFMMLDDAKGKLVLLETIRLRLLGDKQAVRNPKICAFGDAPLLTDVTLDNLQLCEVDVIRNNITAFQGMDVLWYADWKPLPKLRNLRRLTHKAPAWVHPPTRTIILENLEVLHVEGFTSLVSVMVAPALEEATFQVLDASLSNIFALFRQSACTGMRCLTLHGLFVFNREIIHILRAVESLEELTITCAASVEDPRYVIPPIETRVESDFLATLVDELTFTKSGRVPLLPRLEEITVDILQSDTSFGWDVWQAAGEMWESRRQDWMWDRETNRSGVSPLYALQFDDRWFEMNGEELKAVEQDFPCEYLLYVLTVFMN